MNRIRDNSNNYINNNVEDSSLPISNANTYYYKSIDLSNINMAEKIKIINDYTELYQKASNSIKKNKYPEALNYYQEALSLSLKLDDDYKRNESTLNIGIIHFFLGKFDEALDFIKSSFDYFYPICLNNQNSNMKNLILLCKSSANLFMCQLTINNLENSNIIHDVLLNIISKEENLYNQLYCLKYLNNILFKVNSLINGDLNIDENNMNEINKIFINSFNEFIFKGEIGQWLKNLNLIYEKMEKLNDKSGLIYILFTKEMGICLLNNNENNNVIEAKIKLIALLDAISEINNDKNIINDNYINQIIEEYKSKILIIRNLYQELYQFEFRLQNKILNSNRSMKKVNNSIYLILLFKYAKKYFDQNVDNIKLKSTIIQNLDNTINLIINKKIDISEIQLESLDPEISQSLLNIFDNLLKIYRKSILQKPFNKFKFLIKNIANKTLINANNKLLENFFERCYMEIYNGEKINKINFSSNGIKNYYFRINYKNDCILCFENNSNKKPYKIIDISNIKKIKYGLCTHNLIKKYNLLPIKCEPFLFLSIVLNNKTIDLVLRNEKRSKIWFYGLFYYLLNSQRNYKIGSSTNHVLFFIKYKMLVYLNGKEAIGQVNNISFTKCILSFFKNKNYLNK